MPPIDDLLRHLEKLAPNLDLNPGSMARTLAEVAIAQGDAIFDMAIKENGYQPQIRMDRLGIPSIWGPMQVSRIIQPSSRPARGRRKSPILLIQEKPTVYHSDPLREGESWTARARRQIQEEEDRVIFETLNASAVAGWSDTAVDKDYSVYTEFSWGPNQNGDNFSPTLLKQELMGNWIHAQPLTETGKNGWLMYEEPGWIEINPHVRLNEFEIRTTPVTFTSADFQYPRAPKTPAPPPEKFMSLGEMAQRATLIRRTAWERIKLSTDENPIHHQPTPWEQITSGKVTGIIGGLSKTPEPAEETRRTAWEKLLELE